MRDLYAYFSGRVVSIDHENYSEPFAIPKASRDVVNEAIRAVVKAHMLWLLSGRASLLGEDIPDDLLLDDATLQVPPRPIPTADLLPDNLTIAWNGQSEVTALDIADALSAKVGVPLPWYTVRQAIDSAINARYIALTVDSGRWPCDYAHAATVKLRDRNAPVQPTPSIQAAHPPTEASSQMVIEPVSDYYAPITTASSDALIADATLTPAEIQNLEEQMSDIMRLCTANDLKPTFHVRIEIADAGKLSDEKRAELDAMLQEVSERLRLS